MKFLKRNGHYQVKIFEKETITRLGDKKQIPYLVRFTFLRTPWFQILFHKFLISDDDCLHDHPWPFITVLLWGGYYEWSVLEQQTTKSLLKTRNLILTKRGYNEETHLKRHYKAGSILYRPAKYRHRVELIQGKNAYSMVITKKPTRGWGFWTKMGYIPHKDYTTSQQRCD